MCGSLQGHAAVQASSRPGVAGEFAEAFEEVGQEPWVLPVTVVRADPCCGGCQQALRGGRCEGVAEGVRERDEPGPVVTGVVEQFAEAGVSFHLLLGYSCQMGFDGPEEQVRVRPFEAERTEWVLHAVLFEECDGLPVAGGRVVVVDVSHGWIVSARKGVAQGIRRKSYVVLLPLTVWPMTSAMSSWT